jgi:hypothetical protein
MYRLFNPLMGRWYDFLLHTWVAIFDPTTCITTDYVFAEEVAIAAGLDPNEVIREHHTH